MLKQANYNYFLKHSRELSKQHAGKHVAVVDNKIVAIGKKASEVFRKSVKNIPKFRPDRAEILGLNFPDGRKISIRVGDEKLIPVYLHKLPVQFFSQKSTATIGFFESLGVSFNILGRISFFDRFRV